MGNHLGAVMPRTKEQNRQIVAKFRARQREKRELARELSEFMLRTELFGDIRVDVEPTPYGTLKVNYEVPEHAGVMLRDYCDERGLSLDDILDEAIEESIARCTRRREQIATPL